MSFDLWEGVLAEAVKGAEAAGIGTIFAVGHAAGAAGAESPKNTLGKVLKDELARSGTPA